MFLTWFWVCFGVSFAARDVGREVAGPPWLMVHPHLIVLADGVDPRWIDPRTPAHVEERLGAQQHPIGVYRPARLEALPAAARGLVGTVVVLTGTDLSREHADGEEGLTCRAVITAVWAAAIAPEEDDEGMTFFDATDAFGHVAPGRGWAEGHPMLVAEVMPLTDSACPRDALVAVPDGPSASGARRLGESSPTPKARAAALKAVRETALWREQQEAYESSLAAWRKDIRTRKREDPQLDLSLEYGTHAPKRWDAHARQLGADSDPSVKALVDADGTTQLLEVTLGNRVSCAAPPMWFLLDLALRVLDAGLVHGARAVLDWNGDGAWDLVEYGWSSGTVTPLGHAERPLQSFAVKTRALYCPHEAVPPLGFEAAADDAPP
jgi:hypothetical protein